jgi:hypothetical protein
MDDVINKEKSRALHNGEIYLPCFDAKKIEGIPVFSLEDFNNSIFISDTLKRILQQEEFTGLGFEDWKSI